MSSPNKKTIAILEDNEEICEVLSMALSDYNLLFFHTIAKFRNQELGHIDLYILDWMLPDGEGIDQCELIHKQLPQAKIMMLTALDQQEQVIKGLNAGACDYISKPFNIHILKARVNAHLREIRQPKELKFKKLSINPSERIVKIENIDVSMTSNEFTIILELIQNINKVCSRKSLVRKVAGENIHVTDRIIDTHITAIRKKIKQYSQNIKTVRGIGYRFEE